MSDLEEKPAQPRHRARAQAAKAAREARLAAAMRDNLRKRKAQQQERAGGAPAGGVKPELGKPGST